VQNIRPTSHSIEPRVQPELVLDNPDALEVATAFVPFCFSSSEQSGPECERGALTRLSHRWRVDRVHALLTPVDLACVDLRALAASRRAADDAPADRYCKASRDYYSSRRFFTPCTMTQRRLR
jgi:hypothetical protein